jgi:thymidylate kinase
VRRTGRSIAIIGPDGAGKSTLVEAMVTASPLPAVAFEMALYPAGTRGRGRIPGVGFLTRALRRMVLGLRGTWHRARGRLVVYDRYATDALLPLPAGASRGRRWRRAVLSRTCPPTDLTVILDAPAEVLATRRSDSPERCARQRDAYLDLGRRLHPVLVLDSTRDLDDLCSELTRTVFADEMGTR